MPRRYGQHFLTDAAVARRIVEASGVGPDDAVLEIGPGRGVLTRMLAERAGKVMAVEIDRRLFSGLESAGLPANVTLLRADALALDADAIARGLGERYVIVANLPYEITSAFLQKFLTMMPHPRSITVMLQKEVGERIIAVPPRMNRLALFCGYYAQARLLFTVPPGAFSPPPKVQSCILQLTFKAERPLSPDKEKAFFRLIEAGFKAKRKTAKNALKPILGQKTEEILILSGIKADARPEELPYEAWVSLALKV